MNKSAIGVEIGPRIIRLVSVDARDGSVIARADRRVESGISVKVARAAAQALAKSVGAARVPARACAPEPEDESIRAAVEAISGTLGLRGATLSTGVSAAVAETWIGAARGARNVVALVVGDHISAGILINGEPYTGAHGRAGMAAWLALNPVERQDYRRSGGLDAEVSSRGVARRLVWRIEAGDPSSVLDNAGEMNAITAEHVYQGARTHDGVAISVVRDTAKYIGMAVANLVATVDPEVVVLCGEVSRAGDLLLEPVQQECARRLPPRVAETFDLRMSTLGEDVAAIGAARVALK